MNFKNISPGKLKLPLFLTLVLILIVIAAMIFYKNSINVNLEIKNLEIDSSADILLNNFKQTSKTNGVKEWSLTADSAKLINAQDLAVLEKVKVIIFTKNNMEIEVNADNGKLNTKTHDILLSDNVIVNSEGTFLRTDKLHYEKKRHIIYSDGKIEIKKEYSIITADSLFTDLKDSTLKLEGNVKGTFIEAFDQF